jgi:hypothetical protein
MSKRDELLMTLARADGQPWRDIAEATQHAAEIMYGEQADAVLAWLAEQFDHQLFAVLGRAIHGNTIGDPAKGEQLVRERRSTDDILRDASAAFHAVRQHLVIEQAVPNAQDAP